MTTAYFVGRYVDEYAKVLLASLLGGMHVMALSGPGTGKTAIMESVARGMGAYVMVRCDPSTPPEKIKGAIDVKRYLESGEFGENIEGTPFDPDMRIVILDEMTRASEVVQHLNIQLLDRGRGAAVYDYPVVWGTANFVKLANQLEALYDRIGLWYHLPDEDVNVLDFVRAQVAGRQNGGLQVQYPMPTGEKILEVRNAVYSDEAVLAVARFLDIVVGELGAQNIRVNRRRLEQWQRILLACSCYESGPDFKQVSPLALDVFQYAWPAPKPEDQVRFQQIVAECSNPAQHALDQAMASVMQFMNQVAQMQGEDDRKGKIGEMGLMISKSETALKEAGVDPQMVMAASIKFAKWFGDAVAGQPITE